MQIMNGDSELVEYLRRAIGYTLTTMTSEHALFFAYGSGANGKSPFLNVLRALFGDLGAQTNGDMLLEKNGAAGMSQNAASSKVVELHSPCQWNVVMFDTTHQEDKKAARGMEWRNFEFTTSSYCQMTK
ncbi:hypothetical protein [Burkholderia ambifaria]|uniref:hypothetical protein n=1 Tax=Burkholderia ambifaria TaxID=152480 RepID=UPI001FC848DD|nr:hypothetical protein [Burkholderia ambifaria]